MLIKYMLLMPTKRSKNVRIVVVQQHIETKTSGENPMNIGELMKTALYAVGAIAEQIGTGDLHQPIQNATVVTAQQQLYLNTGHSGG